MRPELKTAIGIIGVWILVAIAAWALLMEGWRWLMWIPIAFIIIMFLASGIGILLMRLGFFRPVVATVNHKRIHSCEACPFKYMKDNPVSPAFPIYKCMDAGGRICYNPSKVPRWCPHAAR